MSTVVAEVSVVLPPRERTRVPFAFSCACGCDFAVLADTPPKKLDCPSCGKPVKE